MTDGRDRARKEFKLIGDRVGRKAKIMGWIELGMEGNLMGGIELGIEK